MRLIDALYSALSGGRTQASEARPVAAILDDVKRAYGSRRAAAKAVGVDEKTLRRWESGTNPKTASREKLMVAYRRSPYGTNPPTNKDVRLTVAYRAESRTRTLTGTDLRLAPGTVARVVGRYEAGDMRGARDEFLRGIGDPFYRRWLDDRRADQGMDPWQSDSEGYEILGATA